MSAGTDIIRAANTIVEARRRLGLTQEAVADLIGKSQPTVARMENMHLLPEAVVTFVQLVNALGLSMKLEQAAEVQQ